MNKYSKLFSSLLVVLLMLDIATPALTYAATAELVDEEGVEEVTTSEVTEETVTEETANPAAQPAEEKTEDADQPVVDTPAVVEEKTHPTTQTDAEKLQEENEVTREAMEVAEEEVREAQGHVSNDFGSYIDSVSYSPTEISAGHMTTLTLSFSEKNGYVFQNGQSLTYYYPNNITGLSATVPLNYNGETLATCESSQDSVTCTFNENVEKYDNVQGHFTFKATGKTGLGEGKTVAQDSLGNNVTVVTGASGNSTDTFFYKTGVIDDRYEGEIIWDLTVNASETYRPYGDVVIHDTFGPGQELKGDIIVGDLSESQYELTLHENGFTLVLYESTVTLNSVVISYVTKVTEAGKYLDKLTNAYSLKYEMWPGTDVPHESEGKSGIASVENAIASGGITGVLPASGIVRVVKLDSNTTERLSGAEFTLYKEDGTFIEQLTTNSEGIAESQKLGSGNYYLEESKAPTGYQKTEEKYKFTINQGSTEGIEKVILNTPLPKEVCENFTVNAEDGSKVTITDKEGNVVEEGTVVENGKFVTKKPLEPGKEYKVTVEKEGYETKTEVVTGSEEDCEVTVELTEVPTEEVCKDFTVHVADKDSGLPVDATVTIKDLEGNEIQGSMTNGKFVTESPLEPGKEYKVTVKADGYEEVTKTVYGPKDNCFTIVEVVKEAETCKNFTVNVDVDGNKEEGATVVITGGDLEEEKLEGTTNENGQFTTTKPLTKGKEYEVLVTTTDGQEKTVKITVDENCETTVSLTTTPEKEVCDNFTVNVKKDGEIVEGAAVQIVDENGDIVAEGPTNENGQFVTEEPLTPGNWYDVIVNGDHIQGVKGSEENCETTIELQEVPAEKEVCKDFTVNVEKEGTIVEGATVQIVDENGDVVAEGTTNGNGQFVTEEPLTPGNWYDVIVNGDHIQGVKGSEENCETTIELQEIPSEKETCKNFTVNVDVDGNKEEGATVVITGGDLTEEKLEGTTNKNGQFTTTKPLTKGEMYEVTVTTKDGQEQAVTITVDENCETTISFTTTPKEEVCEDFTVVTEEGATVTITDSEGKEFAKGTVENGKFVTEQPLEVNKDYTVTVEKEGFVTKTETVTGAEDNCEVAINVVRESGTVPPTEPEETPGEGVTPETPDEGEGEETPETPEAPGTETPEVPEEKPSTGGGGGGGDPTPEPTPEFPEVPTPEEPEETPETPEVPEVPTPEVPEEKPSTGGGGGGDPTPEPTPEFPEVPTPEEPEETPDEGEGEETPEVPETPGTETPESTEATIVLTKVDAKNENKVLEGAVFDLYKKDGNVLVAEGLVTNKAGLIKVAELEAGEYYFVERRAPKGYKLNREKQFVKATVGTESMITVENKKRPKGGGGGGGSTTPTEPETPTTPEEGEGEETPETPEGETPETPEVPEGETETPSETPEGTETAKDDNKDETPIITDRPNNDTNSTVDSDKHPTTNTDSTQKVEQEKPAVEKGNVLPQTGETTNMFVLFLAGLLIATGSVLVIRRRTA